MQGNDTREYRGSCHCGAIRFSFRSPPITEGLNCNCSFCRRRQALMLPFTLAPDELQREIDGDALGCYQFGGQVARHYFCKHCGIYPFHETMRKPGHFRVNLGCVEDLDSFALPRTLFNGRDLL